MNSVHVHLSLMYPKNIQCHVYVHCSYKYFVELSEGTVVNSNVTALPVNVVTLDAQKYKCGMCEVAFRSNEYERYQILC